MNSFRIFGMALLTAFVVAGCTADVEDPGSLPDVDVEGGDLPSIDVDPADINISTDTQTVRVPEIEVVPEGEDTVR